MKDKKILITGASGMLGLALSEKLKKQSQHLYLTSFPDSTHMLLDITDKNAVEKLFDEINPDIVYNCAAYTDVDKAQQQSSLAYAVNADGPGVLAENCSRCNSLLVHISTDYVFPGDTSSPYKPTDPTGPNTVYGQSKLAGEQKITESNCRHIIIRTSWLFGPSGKNFVDTIAKLASERDYLKVVNDQLGCPTYTLDLADTMIALAQAQALGIFHLCNPPACSWYDFACEIVKLTNSSCQITACSSKEFPRPAPRPAYSVMDITDTEQILGRKIQPWPDALSRYLCR